MPIVQPLPGHFSATTAYVQADYPYGFKLRCERLCWLERHDRRGYRFVTQTSNPKKPGTWNKPKMSTYTMLAVMGLDEENHVVWTGCSVYEFDKVQEFVAKYGHAFSAEQASDAASMLAAYTRHQARKASQPEPTVKLVDVTDQVMAALKGNNF